MEAYEIAQVAALSTAVVVSLVLGVRSLRQTRDIQEKQFKRNEEVQRREHRQKLLDEIIGWAVGVTQLHLETDVATMIGISGFKKRSEYLALCLHETRRSLIAMMGRNLYIVHIASNFGRDLPLAVSKLISDLKEYMVLLEEAKRLVDAGDLSNFQRKADEGDKHRIQIDQSAKTVIDKACSIKSEEMVV